MHGSLGWRLTLHCSQRRRLLTGHSVIRHDIATEPAKQAPCQALSRPSIPQFRISHPAPVQSAARASQGLAAWHWARQRSCCVCMYCIVCYYSIASRDLPSPTLGPHLFANAKRCGRNLPSASSWPTPTTSPKSTARQSQRLAPSRPSLATTFPMITAGL